MRSENFTLRDQHDSSDVPVRPLNPSLVTCEAPSYRPGGPVITRLRTVWWHLSAGLWFLPTVTVLGSMLLAFGLVEAQTSFDLELGDRWPRLFGAGHDGSRAMLTAIASSMITVAGVVFSVTIVALSLAASQYSPRVLRTFTSDRPTQLVLGVFVGIFAYCLVVLRTIRGGDEGAFVPSLAVLGGLALSLVGIGFLVFFIHHMAASLHASSIVSRVVCVTLTSIDALFPETLGSPVDEADEDRLVADLAPWMPVAARRTGYVISVSESGLLGFARERGRVLRMAAAVGEFVIQGQPIAHLSGADAVTEADEKALDWHYGFDQQRTVEQDAAFGLQQIVDIGSKALSPGINDASTAILCIDRLTQLLVYLTQRSIESPLRRDEGHLRVIARGKTFASFVDLAYCTLRLDAAQKPLVIRHLLQSIDRVAASTLSPTRRSVLAAQASAIGAQARRAEESSDWQAIIEEADRLSLTLRSPRYLSDPPT